MFLFVHEVQIFKEFEEQAHDNGNNGRQYHALYGEGTEGKLRTGQADNHDNRGHNEVGGFAVIHLAFNQYADAGGSDYAEQQHADAAHNRNGDAVDDLAELAAEGEDDGHDSCAADNPGAVHLGDSHNADVLAVGGVRRSASEAADDVGQAVSEQGAGEAGVFDEVAVDDVAGNDQVADMLSKHYESCRSDNQNGVDIKNRRIEMRHLEPRCVINRLEVDHAHEGSKDIAADYAEENRNDAHEAAEGNGADDADSQRKHGNRDAGGVDVVAGEAGHIGSNRCKLQADYGNDGAHSSRREDDINPFCADLVDDEGEEHEQQAKDDEAGLCMVIAGGGQNKQHRRNEGEAGAKIGGNPALGDEDVQQRTQTVHEQAGRGADLKQEGNQHGGAKHGEQMLDAQRDV